MASHMFDLPGVPAFPVFGLDRQFDGYRWLVLWNDPQRLYSVMLGHGPVAIRQFISVTTVLKTPARRFDDPGSPLVGVGATGYESALWQALDGLADDAGWLTDQRNLADWADADPMGPPVEHGPGWGVGEVDIDDRAQPAMTHTHNGHTAWLVDLPVVAICIVRPAQQAHQHVDLVDLSDDLAQYA